ncbi:MAG: hypothetical protein LLG04_00805 [Parachlamydia sp.]|nr:hypothetical protein [Parachlamydia sp.]
MLASFPCESSKSVSLLNMAGNQPVQTAQPDLSQIAAGALSSASSSSTPINLAERQVEKKDPYLYEFPSHYTITLANNQTVDLSGVKVPLSNIFRGGINWGGGSCKMMAQAMQAFGNPPRVFNLPLCICAALNPNFSIIELYSTEETVEPLKNVRNLLSDKIQEGVTHFYIPVDMNNHASLVALIVSGNTAAFRFYDSYKHQNLDSRYFNNTIFLDFLKSLVPSSLTIDERWVVLHPLDQGGENSHGCGYYTVYTALLLTQSEELRNRPTFDAPLYDETHDLRIRAELVVRTLIAYGIDYVDPCTDELGKRDGIFSRLGLADLEILISQLKPRMPIIYSRPRLEATITSMLSGLNKPQQQNGTSAPANSLVAGPEFIYLTNCQDVQDYLRRLRTASASLTS